MRYVSEFGENKNKERSQDAMIPNFPVSNRTRPCLSHLGLEHLDNLMTFWPIIGFRGSMSFLIRSMVFRERKTVSLSSSYRMQSSLICSIMSISSGCNVRSSLKRNMLMKSCRKTLTSTVQRAESGVAYDTTKKLPSVS